MIISKVLSFFQYNRSKTLLLENCLIFYELHNLLFKFKAEMSTTEIHYIYVTHFNM